MRDEPPQSVVGVGRRAITGQVARRVVGQVSALVGGVECEGRRDSVGGNAGAVPGQVVAIGVDVAPCAAFGRAGESLEASIAVLSHDNKFIWVTGMYST